MKTNLRVMALSVVLTSLALCMGRNQPLARAEDVPDKTDAPAPIVAAADEPKPADVAPAEAKPAAPAVAPADNPKAASGKADTNLVQNPITPDQLKLTPALADVIKLVQAGVGEEVLMAYVTNSTDIFNIGPNEILYLHDLGMPSSIITSLIQQDSTPDALARKQAANAVQPLPPGVALTTPANNVFPPRTASLPAGNPVEMAAVNPAPESAVVATNLPPPDSNATSAVVYTVPAVMQQPVNVSYFYTELAPYGTWEDLPGYGHCWRPTVSVWNSSWRPYADCGRWLWTDCGWYWYSDYTWGAQVFHYGRWACPPGRGWVWVPDTHWGPAWVSWRQTRSHCGWAPLPPSARFVAGYGWYHNTLSVRSDCDFDLSHDRYVVVPKNQFYARRPSNYYLAARHAESVIRESSVANNYATVNNTVVNHGVGFETISKAAGGGIRQVSIRPSDTVGPRSPRHELLDAEGRTLTVARPSTASPAITPPAKPISSLSHLRSLNERQLANTTSQTPPPNGSVNSLAPRETPAAAGGPTVIPSGRASKSIIMRGSGRPANEPTPAPAIAQPANNQASTPAPVNSATARRPLPGGRTAAPETVDRSRPSAQTVTARPAPANSPAAVSSSTRVVTRPEQIRVASQPVGQRATVMNVPGPVRISPASGPAPVPRASAPSAPTGASVSPRADSYRAPSPAPAPSPRASAPVQSSSGGSRSSGDSYSRRGSP